MSDVRSVVLQLLAHARYQLLVIVTVNQLHSSLGDSGLKVPKAKKHHVTFSARNAHLSNTYAASRMTNTLGAVYFC